MKIIFETLDELFSDFAEDYIFRIGQFAPTPPLYTYDPKTKTVYVYPGVVVGTCETVEEFKEKYKGNKISVYDP